MTKSEAVSIFQTIPSLAKALGLTPQAVYQWPAELRLEQADRVVGASLRLQRLTPQQAADLAVRGAAR